MRGFLLDTCVVSEFTKPAPNLGVVEWLSRIDSRAIYLSSITIGELHYGIAQISGKRRAFLTSWLRDDVLVDFKGRIVPFDDTVAEFWGALRARLRRSGAPAPVIDAMIAATALQHRLTLVTRNIADFDRMGLDVLNPWRRSKLIN